MSDVSSFSAVRPRRRILPPAEPWRAQDKKVLTVYTYESFVSEWGPGPKVKAAFEKTCDCTVNFVGVADGVALLNRLKLEGASSKADVVVGLDTNLIAEAKDTGLFEASGIDASAAKVPGGFKDDVFVPYDYGHFAVVYDTQTLKNPPKSLKELVEGDPRRRSPFRIRGRRRRVLACCSGSSRSMATRRRKPGQSSRIAC